MAKDSFYRSMSDNELQAMYKEIKKNIDFDSSEGMLHELELIQFVAQERGLQLDNSFSAVKGYLDIAMQETPKGIKLTQRERHYLEDLLLFEIKQMEDTNVSEAFFELRTAKQIVNKLIDVSSAKSEKFNLD